MTHVENVRCFGRLKARELSEEEVAMIGGADGPEPDVYHHFYCANTVSEGNGTQEPCHIGCVYT